MVNDVSAEQLAPSGLDVSLFNSTPAACKVASEFRAALEHGKNRTAQRAPDLYSSRVVNAADPCHDYVEAQRFYEAALLEAEHLFHADSEGGSPLLAPMAYNISCTNAAETKMRTGDRVAALGFLLRAFDKLVTIAESPTSPIALRVNCLRHLRYAFARLNQDFSGEMEQRKIQLLLARGAAIGGEVARIASWLMQHCDPEPAEAPPPALKAN